MGVKTSSKVYADAASALHGVVKDGMTLMCGGFGACGIPENLIDALHASGVEEPHRGFQQRGTRRGGAWACCCRRTRSAK